MDNPEHSDPREEALHEKRAEIYREMEELEHPQEELEARLAEVDREFDRLEQERGQE
jgi:hypothetical protein